MINFTKMHGLGNDFVVINNLDGDVCLSVEEIRQLADRRFGIGFDQLLMIESATSKSADFRYVIFNADGTEVSQCGNGARCFALYIHKKNLSYKNPLTVETYAHIFFPVTPNNKQCERNKNAKQRQKLRDEKSDGKEKKTQNQTFNREPANPCISNHRKIFVRGNQNYGCNQ